MLGYEFTHHDALEDAKAAARIVFAAIEETGLAVEDWLKRVQQPIDLEALKSGAARASIKRDGNPEGPLFGEIVVFTGALSVPRREAATLAAAIGCEVASGVTKKTTLVVVGDQNVARLAGHPKSAKHRKAEDLIKAGAPLRILRESDFKELVHTVDVH
jgi:DNA polymerase-3 subunit epsilon